MSDSASVSEAAGTGSAPLKGSTRPLLAGLLAMLLLVSGGIGMGIFQLRLQGQTMENMVREDATAAGAIITMMRTARERMLILSEVVTMEDDFARDEKLLQLDRLGGQFGAAHQSLEALPLSREEDALRMRQNRLLQLLIGDVEQTVALARRSDLAAARDMLQSVVIPTQSQLLDTLMQWVEIRRGQQAARVEQMHVRQQRAVGTMFMFGLFAILVAGMIAVGVYRWNKQFIGRLTDNAAQLRDTLSELAFRQQAMDAHSIVSIADASGRITHVNDKFCEVSGYRREELIGANHRIVKSGFHPPEFFQDLWETISSGRTWQGAVKNRAKGGQHYWVETTIVPMLDECGQPARYISVRTEITNIMEMEEAVRQANVILKSNVIERTHELELAKQQLEQELIERAHTQASLQTSYDELQSLHRQLQDAQRYLMQSEKLAAVGQLAAGMAHEINNPIGFVSSNLTTLGRYQATLSSLLIHYQQLETGLADDVRAAIVAQRQQADLDFVLEDGRALLEESRNGVERVRKIVQDLRDFSQVDTAGQWQLIDLNQCLDTTLNLLGERFAGGVSIQREYGQLPQVECSPSDLNQVFVNLLNNAMQALPGSGSITLRSGLDGEQAWVEIEDTGEGVPEEILPHIFDPFFTTRPVGQGAGLGLSMAYGVIQQHGGQITVRSQVGLGSAFRVTLPLSQGDRARSSGTAAIHAV